MNEKQKNFYNTIQRILKSGFDFTDEKNNTKVVFHIEGELSLKENILDLKIIVTNKSKSPFTIADLFFIDEQSLRQQLKLGDRKNFKYILQNQAIILDKDYKLSNTYYEEKTYFIVLDIVGYDFNFEMIVWPTPSKEIASQSV